MLRKLSSKKIAVLVGLLTLAATSAFAFVAPQNTDILYPVYDIFVNKLVGNGLNYIVGFLGILVAAYMLMQQKIVPGLFAIIGGIVFLSAGNITTSFGLLF
ncbi:hypothetical protein A2G06_16585 (plasmid) [Geobacter anodireducens]|nr:hypothetical protein A2G06_16585 [Geobacter anodireducens]